MRCLIIVPSLVLFFFVILCVPRVLKNELINFVDIVRED